MGGLASCSAYSKSFINSLSLPMRLEGQAGSGLELWPLTEHRELIKMRQTLERGPDTLS